MSFLADYEPVEDRLRAFWSDHPNGRIQTRVHEKSSDIGPEREWVVVVKVWKDKTQGFDASGMAFERSSDRGVNATSALENCETSAIGRALANLGYAAKGKRPSREEMSKTSPAAGPRSGVATKAGGAAQTPNGEPRPPAAGDHSSVGEGEAPAGGRKPGEGSSSLTSPGYPNDPAFCSHHYASGSPAKVIKGGQELCKLCGTPWVTVVESTTADLGTP